MFLRGLRIENFRAIRKTAIGFEDGTVLIGENDCGISSVLDALDLVLGFDDKRERYPAWLFHQPKGASAPEEPIRIRLRFSERKPGEWRGEAFEPFGTLLQEQRGKLKELLYEVQIHPDQATRPGAEFRLRDPRSKHKTSDPGLVGRFRRMNPVIRVSAGMLTGHGAAPEGQADPAGAGLKVSPEISALMKRISRAVDARLTGKSNDLNAVLKDGFAAAVSLVEMGEFKLGKWEAGLTRSVGEIVGWGPQDAGRTNHKPLQDPRNGPERLGILLLIAALIRARPGGLAPDADLLWVIEEPEAHLHPITLTSVAMFLGLIRRQKIVTTYSGDLLSAVPLADVRRLVRHDSVLLERRVRPQVLSRSEMRRFHYHLRSRFGVASFARMWLLVEGESEYWILPQLARLMGYEFALEGIACVEFAQCGLTPPLKVSRELGIEWHLLTDGDAAGRSYAETAKGFLDGENAAEKLTLLEQSDIERCFWDHGYDGIYKRHSRLSDRKLQNLSPGRVIQAAVRKKSKPFLALSVIEAISRKDSPGIPRVLRDTIETCIRLARQSADRLAGNSR